MVKVKICGITNLEDAQDSVKAGCDALGFVFYKRSQRYLEPREAGEIIRHLSKDIIKIGVFVNAREKTIRHIAGLCGLDMLQFHGDESPEFCARFKGYRVIKAFRIKGKSDLAKIAGYKTFAYLFDTFSRSRFGGTGKKFNWQLLKYPDNIRQQVFLSGGLSGKNVLQAIKTIHPDWVDVSSSVEARPGKKDRQKVKEFIKKAKSTVL